MLAGMIGRSVVAIGLTSLLLGACGGGATTVARTHRDPTVGAVAGGSSSGTTMSPGGRRSFDGMAGGPIEAMTWDGSCRGWIPPEPQIQIDLMMPSSMVASAYSDVDTTMVVAFPDGRFACNDDTNGLNPEVRGEWPAGHYRIFIGTYSRGNSGTFHAEVGPPM